MKCSFSLCKKEMENPITITEINKELEKFLNQKFCNEECFHKAILKEIPREKLKGFTIHYKTSKEI